jgi:hypothetical protein
VELVAGEGYRLGGVRGVSRTLRGVYVNRVQGTVPGKSVWVKWVQPVVVHLGGLIVKVSLPVVFFSGHCLLGVGEVEFIIKVPAGVCVAPASYLFLLNVVVKVVIHLGFAFYIGVVLFIGLKGLEVLIDGFK